MKTQGGIPAGTGGMEARGLHQKSINANVKTGARIRQEILLRKAFMFDTALADAFDLQPS